MRERFQVTMLCLGGSPCLSHTGGPWRAMETCMVLGLTPRVQIHCKKGSKKVHSALSQVMLAWPLGQPLPCQYLMFLLVSWKEADGAGL